MSTTEQAYSKWCKERFPLPTKRDIFELEERISVRFPEHYRGYLLEWNGGRFREPDIVDSTECRLDSLLWMSGIHAPVDYAVLGRQYDLSLFEDNDPPIIIPIGRTTTNGLIMINAVIGDESDGTVFLRTIQQETIPLCDTMEEFFTLLRDSEL